MNSEGNIKEFDNEKSAIKEGYVHQLSQDEIDHLRNVPEDKRVAKLQEYREFRNTMRLKELVHDRNVTNTNADPKYTKKYVKTDKKKQKQIQKSRKKNRK